jgi:hypothetical protein
MGDSKSITNWANKKIQVQEVRLQLLLGHIRDFMENVDWFS